MKSILNQNEQAQIENQVRESLIASGFTKVNDNEFTTTENEITFEIDFTYDGGGVRAIDEYGDDVYFGIYPEDMWDDFETLDEIASYILNNIEIAMQDAEYSF